MCLHVLLWPFFPYSFSDIDERVISCLVAIRSRIYAFYAQTCSSQEVMCLIVQRCSVEFRPFRCSFRWESMWKGRRAHHQMNQSTGTTATTTTAAAMKEHFAHTHTRCNLSILSFAIIWVMSHSRVRDIAFEASVSLCHATHIIFYYSVALSSGSSLAVDVLYALACLLACLPARLLVGWIVHSRYAHLLALYHLIGWCQPLNWYTFRLTEESARLPVRFNNESKLKGKM